MQCRKLRKDIEIFVDEKYVYYIYIYIYIYIYYIYIYIFIVFIVLHDKCSDMMANCS